MANAPSGEPLHGASPVLPLKSAGWESGELRFQLVSLLRCLACALFCFGAAASLLAFAALGGRILLFVYLVTPLALVAPAGGTALPLKLFLLVG